MICTSAMPAIRSRSKQPPYPVSAPAINTTDVYQPEWHANMLQDGEVLWQTMQTKITIVSDDDGERHVVKAARRRNCTRDKLHLLRRHHKPPNSVLSTEQSIRREIAIMKAARHPHHVRLLGIIDDPQQDRVYISMEYLHGGRIQWRNERMEPCLTIEQTRRIFRDVVLGLEYLHYLGIIHRDIKPDNLVWSYDRTVVKIIDYGISHYDPTLRKIPFASWRKSLESLKDPTLFPTNDLMKLRGTDYFIAPELLGSWHDTDEFTLASTAPSSSATTLESFNGSAHSVRPDLPPASKTLPKAPVRLAPVTNAIDVWALGVTLYCFLFGTFPFDVDQTGGQHRDNLKFKLYREICTQDWDVYDVMGACNTLTFGRHHAPNSASVISLLEGVLQKNPSDRMTLRELKKHPWTTEGIWSPRDWLIRTSPGYFCTPGCCRWIPLWWGHLCALPSRLYGTPSPSLSPLPSSQASRRRPPIDMPSPRSSTTSSRRSSISSISSDDSNPELHHDL